MSLLFSEYPRRAERRSLHAVTRFRIVETGGGREQAEVTSVNASVVMAPGAPHLSRHHICRGTTSVAAPHLSVPCSELRSAPNFIIYKIAMYPFFLGDVP